MIDLHAARQLLPDLERQTYLETAAVSLGSTRLHDATCVFMDRWTADGVDFMQAQTAAERAHGLFTARVASRDATWRSCRRSARPGETLAIGARE